MVHKARMEVPSLPRRASWIIRDRFRNRTVVRDVQGVSLAMPWSHRLPDYVEAAPRYGQNLVDLAKNVASFRALNVLDVGANIGDSALQILNSVDARVLCVEGDPYFLEYLHLNTDPDPRVRIAECLLTASESPFSGTAVRKGGTTRFIEGQASDAMPALSAVEIRRSFPQFDGLSLVKCDTDGYDVALIPSIARAWADRPPVLFFEYDPRLTRLARLDPDAVWDQLASLGYLAVAVWDNFGNPLGNAPTDEMRQNSRWLDRPLADRGHYYWDVAAAHATDREGLAALADLVHGQLRTRITV